MARKSFNNLLFDLKEAKTEEDKKLAFKSYLYGNDKIDLINNTNNSINKTIYRKDLVSKFINLSNNDKVIINNIFNDLYNHKKIKINNEIKALLINVFNINRSSEIKNIIYFYYWFSDFIDYNNYNIIKDINYDYYISLSLPKKRRDELEKIGIIKIKDLKNIKLNDIEIDNINNYIYECNNYKVNDKLFHSLLSEDIRNVIKNYNKLKSFNKVSKVLNISPTNVRMKYNYAIKKVIDFFCTKVGSTALRLMFSIGNGVIKGRDIENIFKDYGIFLEEIFKNDLVYKIKYDKDNDSFTTL